MVAGIVVRIVLTATSIGTNDVIFNIMWADLADRYGIAHAYAHHKDLNHPPLALLLFRLIAAVARAARTEYTDCFRLVQSAADVVTAFALVAIGRLRNLDGRLLALLFFLSPAAIAISAFHCNTDATMVALITCAALCALRGRSGAAGVVLGLATGIKIVPLFAVPFFFMALPRRARFAIGYAVTVAAIFIPPRIAGGPAVWSNIFGYAGYSGKWGITALLLRIREYAAPESLFRAAVWYANDGKYVLLVALALLFAWFTRQAKREALLLAAIPLVYLGVLFLAPGFGIQYLIWPLSLLPFALPRRWAIGLSAAFSAYVCFVYTVWSRGFPWWYADSIRPSPLKPAIVLTGLGVWMLIGAAIVIAVRALSSSEPSAARSA
ncbi:MAG: hypothetical protein QOI24_4600 [Acidobacteriota bacterium]|jgi:Gpi18-like mannosyltransferase|nr:hypothetical protein [Acidobacteriota bacterium]